MFLAMGLLRFEGLDFLFGLFMALRFELCWVNVEGLWIDY